MRVRVVRNRYVDSVRLMKVAADARTRDGVAAFEAVMGTPANLEALGLSCDAGPADVVLAVDGPEEALDVAEAALSAADEPVAATEAAPRSLAGVDANVALVSVPGDYAVLEAHRALSCGMHVFLFSDHVGVEHEVALKRRGAERGLLVMGPECGTAMLGGVGLGFANAVREGPVGIVAAAGTGAQEASVLLDRAGTGVSHIVGVGGRDLSADVGGIMFRQGMELLAADDGTDTLLLVSKPPDPAAVRALGDVDVGGKRVVAAFVGWDGGDAPFEVHATLEAGAAAAAGVEPTPDGDDELPRGTDLLGLFSGGSLAHEAQTILGGDHRILDLGEEEYTQGRPHPMVDLELRRRMLREQGPEAGCILLDVVLGHGSHPDPAGELAGTLAELARRPAGDRPRLRHRRGSPGRGPAGGDAARGRRPRRADERRRGAHGEARGRVKIAMLTYSVKPRGGVVHALEVAEALARRGHQVELMALARHDEELYRAAGVPLRLVRHVPLDAPFDERIQAMMETYAEGLRPILGAGGYDVFHAQDCLSANAALALRDDGVIGHVIRTVHHVDDFTSPSLIACQDRSIVDPDHLLCVSAPWIERLADEYGVRAELVRNGVDTGRYRPARDDAERAGARAEAGLGDRFAVMTVGGIEPRKGSLTLLDGFAALRDLVPEHDPLLLIAGGTTLFDYRHERDRFAARAAELGIEAHVRVLGPLAAEAMERLFRAADAFAFPSIKEGFGLAALEALAAGLPVVASDLDVFRGFLADGESALLTPAGDGAALGRALARIALDPALADRLRAGGRRVVPEYTWDAAAAAHERAYEAFLGAGVG